MSTKPCPNCELPLKVNATACACGWKAVPKASPTSSAKQVDEPDPERWRCAHEILGQRCPDAGAHKRGDRWLCALHAGKKPLAETLSATIGRDAIAKARAMLKAAKPIKRVGDARPIQEFTAPYEKAVDEWESGRE